jgi:hypothetical protein
VLPQDANRLQQQYNIIKNEPVATPGSERFKALPMISALTPPPPEDTNRGHSFEFVDSSTLQFQASIDVVGC